MESGSRHLFENVLPGLYETHPENVQVDLVTCYPDFPRGLDTERGEIFRVTDYARGPARNAFLAKLAASQYDVVGIICSGEPIMTKWKWALAWKVPAKLFILNENGDYFWVDRGQLGTIKHFALYRAGLSGSAGIATLLRLALFPFTLAYLLLFAAYIHMRRIART